MRAHPAASARSCLFALAAAFLMIVAGCDSTGGAPPDTGGGSGSSQTPLQISYDDSSDPTVVAKITDPASQMTVTIRGTKDAEDLLDEATRISGTTRDGDAFDATYVDGLPAGLSLSTMELTIVQVDDETYEILISPTGTTSKAHAGLFKQYAVSSGYLQAFLTLRNAYAECKDDEDNCPDETRRHIGVLMELTMLQNILDTMFNEECIVSDGMSPSDCMSLLMVVDTLGRMADGVIESSPNMPPSVHSLCFALDEDCDTFSFEYRDLDANDLSIDDEGDETVADGSDPTDDTSDDGSTDDTAPLTGIDVIITGPGAPPYQVCAGESRTFTAYASGIGAERIRFTWDLLGTGADIESNDATSTDGLGDTVYIVNVIGKGVGTVTLIAEARDTQMNDLLVTTGSVTLSTVGADGCPDWDALDDYYDQIRGFKTHR